MRESYTEGARRQDARRMSVTPLDSFRPTDMRSASHWLFRLAILGAVSCSRYQWVPDYESPECAAYHGPPTSGLTEITSVPDAPPGFVAGRILARGTTLPVQGAVILLDADSLHRVTTQADGRFTIPASPGTHRLFVRRIGYYRHASSVTLPFPQPIEVVITLAETVLDGPCSGFAMVQVKKPWW
jgi:hypothetical protein